MRKTGNHMRLLGATGLMLSAALAGAEVIDTTIDYSANPANGQWILWARPTGAPDCNVVSTSWDAVNERYVIEAELSDTCGYMYFRTTFAHALDGTSALTADIKVEATSGSLSDATVKLGYGVDYPGFGANGRTVASFSYAIASAGWQSIGGDATPFIESARATTQKTFMLSEPGDLLAKSVGPVVYLFNRTVDTSTPRSLTLRVTIDNLRVQHDGSALDSSYLTAATTAAGAYSTRIAPVRNALDTDIDTGKSTIDGLSLSGRPALAAALSAQAATIQNDHDAILAAAAARTDATMKVPTQDQYERDVVGLQTLNNLLSLSTFVDGGGAGLVYYPWEATGKNRLDDLSLGVPATPLQTSSTIVALNELEPVSVVLQNLNEDAVSISQVEPGTFTNEFGEELPNSNLDIRVVKNWYTGSATSINVRPGDVKVRVPELLLKDDALVRVDAVAKSNELRIESSSTVFYQDISSPTAKMPNDALVEDAATLQPFAIGAFHSKQLWLTVDTRSDVRPGSYSGNLVVSYQIDGDVTPRTLQVPLELTVLPVSLQSSNLTYGIYYHGRIDPTKAGLNSEYKTETQYTAEMLNMLAHGVDHPTQYIGSSLTQVSDYVTLRESLGLPCDKYFFLDGIGNIGRNTTTATTNATNLLGVLQSDSSCSNARLYMYGEDEATGSSLDAQRDALQAVTNAGGYSFVAGYTGTYARIGDRLDTLVFSGKPNDAEIDLWRLAGKDVYSYGNPQVGVPDPNVYRTNFGLLLWQHDYTGAMDYAYQDGFPGRISARGPLSDCATSTTHYCSLWNDFDSSQYYDHVFTYPTTTGVIDTIQWEGFREAVDDTRYLATLQAIMQASADTTLVTVLEGVLEDLKGTANLNPAETRFNLQYALALLNQPPTFSDVQLLTGAADVYVSGEASDPEGYLARVTVSIDGGAEQEVSRDGAWSHLFSGLADGPHTVRYIATDYWGRTTEDEQVIEVDTLSPGC